jgi:acetyltransferase-like isoleucine patch superfamily enzyme
MSKIKRIIRQAYLGYRFRKNNKIGRDVIFSNSSSIGKGCLIGKKTSFEGQVILCDNIKIGSYVHLSNIIIRSFSIIESYVRCVGTNKGKITIGENSYIGINNYLDTSDDISIGDFVQIAGPSTALWTHTGVDMVLRSIPLSEVKSTPFRKTAPITIEKNVYIGGNCTIYPGITIGHHSIVAPNSAVTKDVLPFSLVGGVPAKFIKAISI